MSYVMSPSNMMTFHQCPLKFYGQTVTKEIKWKASKQKLRGTAVHRLMEECARDGYSEDTKWDAAMDADFVRRNLDRFAALRRDGWSVLTEHPVAVDRRLVRCGFWDEDAFLRCRADAIAMPPDSLPDEAPLLVDYKTGRKWDDEDFQLKITAVIASIAFDRPRFRYEYWYVDDGAVVAGEVSGTPADVLDLMRRMLLAERDGCYLPQRNRFCRWCDWWQTPKCGVGR